MPKAVFISVHAVYQLEKWVVKLVLALRAHRIVARQNFSCCNNCGHTEIWDEIDAEEELHPVLGYVFYHLQVTERAMKTGQLLMAYGSAQDDEASLQSVGQTVVHQLQEAGLNASWSGSIDHPIVVSELVWRKRR